MPCAFTARPGKTVISAPELIANLAIRRYPQGPWSAIRVKRRWYAAIVLAATALVLLALWLARSYVAVQFARSYFQSHGVASSVEIGELGFSGVSARFALGPAEVPEISVERIELHFDPLRWLPYV